MSFDRCSWYGYIPCLHGWLVLRSSRGIVRSAVNICSHSCSDVKHSSPNCRYRPAYILFVMHDTCITLYYCPLEPHKKKVPCMNELCPRMAVTLGYSQQRGDADAYPDEYRRHGPTGCVRIRTMPSSRLRTCMRKVPGPPLSLLKRLQRQFPNRREDS